MNNRGRNRGHDGYGAAADRSSPCPTLRGEFVAGAKAGGPGDGDRYPGLPATCTYK
jgi:hypothetical protein